eukprot:jgi/Chlat1/1777/Chrsp134S02094
MPGMVAGGGGGDGGGSVVIARLEARRAHIREGLAKSQAITDQTEELLKRFSEHVAELEAIMTPVQRKTNLLLTKAENIERSLAAAAEVLHQFDVSRQVEDAINRGPRGDIDAYLRLVKRLAAAVAFLSDERGGRSFRDALAHAKSLLVKAIATCEEEMKGILSKHARVIDPAKVDEALAGDTTKEAQELVAPFALPQLRALVGAMLQAGHAACLGSFRDARIPALEGNLKRLGIDKISSREDVAKLSQETIEEKSAIWCKLIKAAVRVLFAAERKLALQVVREKFVGPVFAETISSSMNKLVAFGLAVANARCVPERLFLILEMFHTLQGVMPELEVMLAGKHAQAMAVETKSLLSQLATCARSTFSEFEETIRQDSNKYMLPDGTVHPISSHVVNYVKRLFDHSEVLSVLFAHGSGSKDNSNASMAAAVASVFATLFYNLDVKARSYKSPALVQLFLMNNVDYVVRSVQSSAVGLLLGAAWTDKHKGEVKKYVAGYQAASWNRALACLGDDGVTVKDSGELSKLGRAAVKDKFKKFNNTVDELYSTQVQWTIPDRQLRELVRERISSVLVPMYRQFVTRYERVNFSSHKEKYIKYSPQQLQDMLASFYESRDKKRTG